ncbi:hypothetical protein MBAG_02386 [Coprobacillus sp. D7]|nr:hypothetical protein MBAG_02386 [Coprobacillus sp. D7]
MNNQQNYKVQLNNDYTNGLKKIKKGLDLNLFPRNFQKEVLNDLLEVFLRNQAQGKKFSEVVDHDVNSFIKDIIEAYVLNMTKKEIGLNSLKIGLIVSIVFTVLDFCQYGFTVITMLMPLISFILISITQYILYQTATKISIKLLHSLGFIFGIVLYIFEFSLVKIFPNLIIFNPFNSMFYPVFLAIQIIFYLIVCLRLREN